eukprot:scaffold52986_cov17-Tisochrysis_lutea.AAC.3
MEELSLYVPASFRRVCFSLLKHCPGALHYSIWLSESGFINSFPFDPVGLNSPKHAVNEVKNGRLAMVSVSEKMPGCRVDCCLKSGCICLRHAVHPVTGRQRSVHSKHGAEI